GSELDLLAQRQHVVDQARADQFLFRHSAEDRLGEKMIEIVESADEGGDGDGIEAGHGEFLLMIVSYRVMDSNAQTAAMSSQTAARPARTRTSSFLHV